MPPEIVPFLSFNVLFFLAFGLGALATAMMTVVSPNPIRSALFLVLNLFCVAVLYLLLNAYFLAAVQVVVYAGAIMVLFLFVIMLLNLGTPDRQADRLHRMIPVAVIGALILASVIGYTIARAVPTPELSPEAALRAMTQGTVEGIGHNLYNPNQPWLFPFEITSVLLLVASIGAIVLAKRRLPDEIVEVTHGTE